MTTAAEPSRSAERALLVRRGIWLNYATIGYNSLEAVGALVAGLLAGSVALIGFGFDSVIEVTAALAARWRLRADLNPVRRERAELSGNGVGGRFGVAGHHHHLNFLVMKTTHRLLRLGADRIGHRQHSERRFPL